MKKGWIVLLLFALSAFAVEEEETLWEEGPSALEYTHFLQEALAGHDWWSAINYAKKISTEYGKSPFAVEVPYVIGEAYFNLEKWGLANENLSQYLSKTSSPKHFEEAIHYKFLIAEKFRDGAKKHLFGADWLPKIISGADDALMIYDDVIAALPHHEIAAKALLGKAEIQAKNEDYKPNL